MSIRLQERRFSSPKVHGCACLLLKPTQTLQIATGFQEHLHLLAPLQRTKIRSLPRHVLIYFLAINNKYSKYVINNTAESYSWDRPSQWLYSFLEILYFSWLDSAAWAVRSIWVEDFLVCWNFWRRYSLVRLDCSPVLWSSSSSWDPCCGPWSNRTRYFMLAPHASYDFFITFLDD